MDTLRKIISSFMESSDPILNELDKDELKYIDDLMQDLNRNGRHHSISKIIHDDKKIEVETNYKIAHFKK